jgi:hypothetical protein
VTLARINPGSGHQRSGLEVPAVLQRTYHRSQLVDDEVDDVLEDVHCGPTVSVQLSSSKVRKQGIDKGDACHVLGVLRFGLWLYPFGEVILILT